MELTKEEIDVILSMMNDMEIMYGLNPEELELKKKLERGNE
jgi:hypothetical protein